MRRDTTLITDPNSLFAISRALRKRIVETDPNPQNRNNAIRDEKHVAYKSSGKGGYESFKYDILTSLDQLDNYFLELETVLGKITEDERVLQEDVRKRKGETTTPKKPRGRPPKAKGAEETGAGYYRGGALGDVPEDESILDFLRGASKSSSNSRILKKAILAYLPQVEAEFAKYKTQKITRDELNDNVESIYDNINDDDDYKIEKLNGTDEEDDFSNIFSAMETYILTLPSIYKKVEPEAEAEVEPVRARSGVRRNITLQSGNEFIISALSKINLLLIKLIAEYNGKILVNWKEFLQSDLEEIALKVLDSRRRFIELNKFLKTNEFTKLADISKFLSTIDKNFSKFIALTSRSIANFANPDAPSLLPNFSQQLSSQLTSQERRTEEGKIQQEKAFDDRIDKLVKKYIPIREEIQKVQNKVYEPLREKMEGTAQRLEFLNVKFEDGSINKRERLAFALLAKQLRREQKELDKVTRRLSTLQDKRNAIEDMPEYGFFPRGV